MELQNWTEMRGRLERLLVHDYTISIIITKTFDLEIPAREDVVAQLEGLIGKKIALLRTDITYLAREDKS
ncbi:MAG: hypothetical protein HZA84_07145 [Thaumarchaeota archaeon]|nr:hypothetical protein [Nitrososphaerota archaeon]